MLDICFHVGFAKTGSTFLQKCVFPNVKGIYYPSQKDREHFNFLWNITEYKDKNYVLPYLDKKRMNLISFEGISGSMWGKTSYEYKSINWIKESFPDAKIIFFTREYDSLIKSVYKHFIRSGGTLIFDDFVDKYISKERYTFGKYIKTLNSLFKEVLILRYEDFRSDKDKIIDKVVDFVGGELNGYEDKMINVGITDNQVKILRLLNHLWKTKHHNGLIKMPTNKIKLPTIYMMNSFNRFKYLMRGK